LGPLAATVDDEQRLQLHGVAGLADLVDEQDVADGDLLLATTCAHNRVHVSYSLSLRERSLGNRLTGFPLTTQDIGSVGAPTVKTTGA